MIQLVALLATFAAGIPVAIAVYIALNPASVRTISKVSISWAFAASLTLTSLLLALEIFFELKVFGLFIGWVVNNYPSAVREDAEAPLALISALIIGITSYLGLHGVIKIVTADKRGRGVGLFSLAVITALIFFALSSDQIAFDDYWLGLPVWPFKLAVDYFPPLVGISIGLSIGIFVVHRINAAPIKSDNFPLMLIYLSVTLLLINSFMLMRLFTVETEDADRRKSLPVNAIQSTLPPGFDVSELTAPESFQFPSALASGPNGVTFVATREGLFAVIENEGSNQPAEIKLFHEISHATGIHWADGGLYVSVNGDVIFLSDQDEDLVVESTKTLVSGLPVFKYSFHSNNGLIVGPKNRLFVTLGGTSDHGPEIHEQAGSVLSMEKDGSEMIVFAKGLRNPYGITRCPDGEIYVSDNGPDQLDKNLLDYPPDELNKVVNGGFFGYPEVFGNPPLWHDSLAPVALLPARAGSAGLECYSGTAFPEQYVGNLFIALFGTLAGEDGYEGGRRIVRVELSEENGVQKSIASQFASGFVHPVDVAEDSKGNLLVLDWEVGQILRISYERN